MSREQKIELSWIIPSALIPIALLGLLLYAYVTHGIHVPGQEGMIDPRAISQTAPFNTPGVVQTGPGTYQATIVGKMWTFEPKEIRVKAGAEVTFVASSADVIHGMRIQGTNVNIMLLPGQISRKTARFVKPGEYLLICPEYCGIGHHLMSGKVIVE